MFTKNDKEKIMHLVNLMIRRYEIEMPNHKKTDIEKFDHFILRNAGKTFSKSELIRKTQFMNKIERDEYLKELCSYGVMKNFKRMKSNERGYTDFYKINGDKILKPRTPEKEQECFEELKNILIDGLQIGEGIKKSELSSKAFNIDSDFVSEFVKTFSDQNMLKSGFIDGSVGYIRTKGFSEK